MEDVIYGINGPVVTVKNTRTFSMMEMVHVGTQKLVGEVIGINDKMTTIQVYEETTGLKPGDPVTGTGAPMNRSRHLAEKCLKSYGQKTALIMITGTVF